MNAVQDVIANVLKSFPDAWLSSLETQLEGTAPLVAPSPWVAPLYTLLESHRAQIAPVLKLFLAVEEAIEKLTGLGAAQ